MPEIVRALASPLANVDKITIVSTGNGDARDEQDHWRHRKNGGAVPALFENVVGDANVRTPGQSPPDRRQDGKSPTAKEVAQGIRWRTGVGPVLPIPETRGKQ